LIGQNKTFANSFVIHGVVTAEQRSFYTKSIENTNMEQFRLKTEKVVLKFKNGFLLELLPAKELSVKNIATDIDINKYSDHVPTLNYKHPIFQILDSGWITAEVQNNTK
jgi:hypothetical protein